MATNATYQWATQDKDGEIATWSDYPDPERAAREYVANRARLGLAPAGAEKVLRRRVSPWQEVPSGGPR